jgi:hypothetical protein
MYIRRYVRMYICIYSHNSKARRLLYTPNMYIYIYIYIYSCIENIYSCIENIHIYIYIYMPYGICFILREYIHTYIHTYIHIYAYIHTYILTYIHTNWVVCIYIHVYGKDVCMCLYACTCSNVSQSNALIPTRPLQHAWYIHTFIHTCTWLLYIPYMHACMDLYLNILSPCAYIAWHAPVQ